MEAFATLADEVAASSKRLRKAALLADYFAQLDDRDLRLAARYLTGQTLPLWDHRSLQVGMAAIFTALASLTKLDENTLKAMLVQLGDAGELAAAVLPPRDSTLTLQQVESALAGLVDIRGTGRKVEGLVSLLAAASPHEAKYIVKLVSSELRIGLKEGAVEDALARMASVDVAKVQRLNMLVGDIGETAVLVRHNRFDDVRMRLFHPLKLMLATPAKSATDVHTQMPPVFAVEDKFDGIRAQAHVSVADDIPEGAHGVTHAGAHIALFSRTLDELTPSFFDLVPPLAALVKRPGGPRSLLLDGEIVAVDGDAILPFTMLQPRLGRKPTTLSLFADSPVAFIAFDVLAIDGVTLLEEPLDARRRKLVEAIPTNPQAIVRCAVREDVDATADLDVLFAAAQARGNEGLMIKDPSSAYKPGRRGRDWLKMKKAMATLDVVVTAVETGHGKRRQWLSDYTFAVRQSADDATLLDIGKAYSGLTEAEIMDLTEWFRAHTVHELNHGKKRIVEPSIVLEVTFDKLQPSDRHPSGYALRFPRIVRIRRDKSVEDIDTLDSVERMCGTP